MNFLFKGELIDYDFFNCESVLQTNNKTTKNNLYQKNEDINFNNSMDGDKENFKNSSLNKESIVFLHGWGGNKNSFKTTINLLKHKFNILAVTMPTIQSSCVAWNLVDYANLILMLCKLYSINSIYIVCHSFGFRVANLIKQKIEIKKIVVTGGAGLKKFSILKKLETNNNKILLKQARFKYLYNSIASEDYKALSPTNKKTFNAVVGVAFNKFCTYRCPMLLFWGKRDLDTKLWIAKTLKRKNNAQLIITNANHFAYLKESALFNNAVVEFLK